MPLYRITAPNGQTYQIEGPEGASDADVANAVMAQHPEAGTPISAAKPAPFSLSDTLVSAAQGALGGTKSTIEGVTGAGSGIGETLESAQKWLGSKLSPERQAEQQRRALLEKRAAETGKPLEEVAAGLGGIKEAPIQSIAQGVGSSVPTVLAGVGAAALGTTLGAPVAIAAAVGIGTKYLLGALQGAGEVKGSIYDAVKDRLTASGMPEAQAKQQAVAAQDYLGKNWDTIAAGAGIGALAGGTGVEKDLVQKLSKPVAKTAAKTAAEKGALRQFGEAAAKEGLGEGVQGGQGQAAENVALTREGYKTDVMQGVYGAAARDAALGALTGAAVHPFTGSEGARPQTPAPSPENKGAQLPPEAPAGTQGTLFTEAEMGKPVPAAAPEELPAEVKTPEGQQDLGLDYARQTGDVTKELERLKQQPQTPEVKARIAQLEEDLQTYSQLEVERLRSEKQDAEAQARADRAGQAKFPALANTPDLITQSDEVKARTQGELFPGEDLGVTPAAEPTTEPTLRPKKETGPRQLPLGLRRNPEGQPTTFGQPEPTITSEDVLMTAVPIRKGMESWIDKNVIGSTRTQLLELIKRDPTLVQGSDQRAKLLRSLTAAEVPAFKEAPSVKPTPTPTPAVEQRAEPGTSEPSVGVPSEPQPAPAGAAPAAEPVTPDRSGLVSAGRPAVQGDEAQRTEPAAVTPGVTPGVAPAAAPELSLQEKLQAIIDDAAASKRSKQTAFAALDSLQDPDMNETAEDRQQNEAYAEKALKEAEAQRNANVPVVGAETSQDIETGLYAAVKRGDTRGALQAILDAPKGVYNELDRAVARRLLLAKTLPSVQVVPKGQLGEQDDKIVGGVYNPYTDSVYLTEGYVGGHTLLHELVHGFVHTAISLHQTGERVSAGVRTLQDVYNHVAKTNPALMSEYGMTNLSEFASEAMSNKAFQTALAKIPYRRENAFTEFARAVLRVLGLSPTERHTALASAMISVDNIMTSGRALQEETTGTQTSVKSAFAVAPGTESLVDSMGPLDREQKSGLQKLISAFNAGSSPAEPSYATKFRTQTADAAATIEHRLREKFDGAVRNSLGKLNPMGLYRQAQDHAKLLLEYFQQGSLVKDPVTGLWRVTAANGVRPPAEVYALIDKWAAKNGYSRERGTQIASRILEGVRLDAMRASNKTGATNFALHLKDAEIDQLVREYKADPDLQAMSKLMDEARIAMVDNMVAVGRLTPETGDVWKDTVGYVPFDRLDDEDFVAAFSKVKKISNKGIAQVGKLPELVGSIERPVGNVFDNYLNTLGWMVGQTMNTDATVQTLRSLEDAGHATKLRTGARPTANSVGAYVKGEMQYWELPSKYDVLAFKDLNPPKAGWLRNLGAFSNVLRKSVTVLPPFALKQVTDDVQRAILTSGVKNPGALLRMALTNFPKLALAELRGIQHPMVREFGALGLTGEYDFQAGKPATSLLQDLGYKKREVLGSSKFGALLHRLDGITRASDLAVRKAIYDQTMKEANDQLLAQTRAREFINFRRRGASDFVGAMVTVIPFFNAYIQGMDVLYRAASGKDSSSSVDRAQARRLFWSRAGTVMMLASLYAVGKDDDDEDYKEMDLRTRDSNWILPGGYKIPVPGELGALFKVIPERVVEYMKRQGTPEEQDAWEATRTALSYIYEQYVGRVTPVPQAVKPLLEAWSNKSFLTGRPLEGFHHQQMEPSMRKTEQTSELAIAIANFSRDSVGVEVSPIMVDNALRGYFGSTAALLTATTDSLLNPTRVDRPLHKWAMVSNYMYDPVGTRRMTEFYEEREKIGKASATLKELLKTDMDRAEAYATSHQDELMLESAINSTLQQLENTRAYRKHLNSPDGAKEMPAAQREAELQEIKKMEIELVSWVREAKAEIRKAQ